ncbi:hypothetical protein DPMN_004941, partial [Dreissena polymorpha]
YVSHYRVSVANVTDHSNISEWSNDRLCYETQGDDPPFPSSGTHSVLGVFCKEPVVGNTIRIQLLSSHTQLVLCDVYVSQENLQGYRITVNDDDNTWRTIYTDTSTGGESTKEVLNMTFVTTSLKISKPFKIVLCEVKVFGDCPENRCRYDCSKECYCRPPYTLEDKIAANCPHGCLNSSRWAKGCDKVKSVVIVRKAYIVIQVLDIALGCVNLAIRTRHYVIHNNMLVTWMDNGYLARRRILSDVNECADVDNCLYGTCINEVGGYRCQCPPNYQLNATGTGCVDIDECRETPGICKNGHCLNTFGSYKCICPDGYGLNLDTQECVDVDECRASRNPCYDNAICNNTLGSYRCMCIPGYQLATKGGRCIDINECQDVAGICTNGDCSNSEGSYQCTCNQGYRLAASRDSCLDIDECRETPGICKNGHCQNTFGSYKCICPDGYRLHLDTQECVDVDECRASRNPFYDNAICNNTLGSYRCMCIPGYQLATKGGRCIDINECQDVAGICTNGDCSNLEGSYQCTCNQGYRLAASRDSCLDINECELQPGPCRNGTCENRIGSYECRCSEGFKLSDRGDCEGSFVVKARVLEDSAFINIDGTVLVNLVTNCQIAMKRAQKEAGAKDAITNAVVAREANNVIRGLASVPGRVSPAIMNVSVINLQNRASFQWS